MSRPEPVTPNVFFLLYKEAIDEPTPRETIENAFLLLAIGRLGLRPDTVAHLHEGWVDWRTGRIEVPVHEPCVCADCQGRVRAERSGAVSSDIVADDQWHPTSEAGARSVPFDWSKRVTAVLAEFFDHFDYIHCEDIEGRITELTSVAPGIDPVRISPAALRRGAAVMFADLGYDAETLARVLGNQDVSSVEPILRRGVASTRPGEDVPAAMLRERYRVALHPEQFPEESFDPTDFDAAWRLSRADDRATTSRTITNPRPVAEGANPGAKRRLPTGALYTTESELVTTNLETVESLVSAWVNRQDERERPAADPLWTGNEPAAESTATGDGPGGTGQETAAEPAAKESLDVGMQRTDPDVLLADATFRTTAPFVSETVTAGTVATGAVGVADGDLVFELDADTAPEEASVFVIPVESVVDFSLAYEEVRLEQSGVGVAAHLDDDRIVVSVGLEDRSALLTALFGDIVGGTPAVVTHPQREGGRVMEGTATAPALLEVANGRIELRPLDSLAAAPTTSEGEEPLATIDPVTVTEIDTCLQRYDTTSWKSIEVTHLPESTDTDQSTRIGFESRRNTKLLRKFLTQHHKYQMNRLRNISLTARGKQFLVGMHSFQAGSMGPLELADMMGLDESTMGTLLDSLVEKDLLENSDSPSLTPFGRVAVTEKLDDVNI
jgi:helix-turn-helix protein